MEIGDIIYIFNYIDTEKYHESVTVYLCECNTT